MEAEAPVPIEPEAPLPRERTEQRARAERDDRREVSLARHGYREEPREEGRRRYRDNDLPSKPGEWNGPIPEFLAVSAVH